MVAIRHRKVHIRCEILEVVDCLLYGVHLEAFDAEVWIRVAETVKSMLKDDGATVLLLRYENLVNHRFLHAILM